LKVRVNRAVPVKAMVTRDKLPAAGKERRVGLSRVEQLRTDRERVCVWQRDRGGVGRRSK
jgi:hypothetical protein